ncbi:interferon gamma receptor 2 [Saccopteryx leptura]|uniref:interferon gamma receptor 2 n=1 Tax=Saccopteryx leptura TaxID=249018 RepID=UPI00339BFB70
MRRPPPLLWLPLLLQLGAAAPPADSPSQLPAPQNPRIRLYNAEQVLSWEPVSLSNETRPVVYRVQFKFSSNSEWSDLNNQTVGVNCSKITVTKCNFTRTSHTNGFDPCHNITLRVRAELQDRVSAWMIAPWFIHYQNVTIGPPNKIWVTPGEGSLIIKLSPPFDIGVSSMVTFSYYVHYWEEAGIQQDKGPFRRNFIVLNDLKPLRVYCLQVRAQLSWSSQAIYIPGHLSDVSCHRAMANASTRLQHVSLVTVGTFLTLFGLAGACLVVIQRYKGLIKHWFHSPPGIPVQVEEYLKNPAQPILEALDNHSSLTDDAWDPVCVVSLLEKE